MLRCPLCSFCSSQRQMLDKHLQWHTSQRRQEAYCDACRIQFMCVDTYQVHKKQYCRFRHETSTTPPASLPFKPSADTVVLRGSNGGLIHPQAIYAAISTDPLILLPCSLVNGDSGVIASSGPGIVVQTGASYQAVVGKKKEDEMIIPNRKTSHPAMSFSSRTIQPPEEASLRKRKMSEGDVLNLEKSSKVNSDIPLDLSLKKRKTSDISYDRPSDHSSDDCSRKTPNGDSNPGGRSPSGSESIHCYDGLEEDSDVSKDKPVLLPGIPPPKVLKKGNNVCEECNIVFYKYDNYLAHKKHYCAFRRQQLSVLAAAAAAASSSSCHEHSSEDNNSNHSETTQDESNKSRRIDTGEHVRVVISKPPAFICEACGVKFSSLDTLNAHQTYYCSRIADSAMSKLKSKSEASGSPNSLEPPFVGPEEWKCNYCETTCSSYETIRRHLMTHSEVRGFRCMLCGYRGNTLRGMRTHAYEHLNEGSSIDDFMSSAVISDSHSISHEDERTTTPDSHEEEVSNNVVKTESRDSPDTSRRESVNPLAFCDVVIKTENEQTTSGDESRECETRVKSESESESPPAQSISVIRCAPERRTEDGKSDPEDKLTELKYCKSCDISFYHMSNFIAHKKYYCSKPVTSTLQESTVVL